MIIKKKYTTIKKNIEKTPEVTAVEVEVPQQEVKKEPEVEQKTVKASVEEIPAEPEKEAVKPLELDLSLDDIQFEQRSERREGTRRRGYRRTQDRNVVSRAQKDAISIKEAARQEGYKEGIIKAEKDIEILKEKLSEFYNYKERVFDKVSECVMDVSVEIAKKIIKKQIEEDRTSVIPIIRSAIEEVNKIEEKITLRVMPQDVEIVRDKLPELFSGEYFEAKISVIPDKNIKEGGVIVETSNGIIDASIETQIEIIENALKKKEES